MMVCLMWTIDKKDNKDGGFLLDGDSREIYHKGQNLEWF